MYGKISTTRSTETYSAETEQLGQMLHDADTVIIGAGAGLSTSAGFQYAGGRFRKYFGDFAQKYHFTDMYAGSFYPYSSPEESWAFWSRNIYINRFIKAPSTVYPDLFELVRDKDYFVLTTNVDHQFQKNGFDKARLFYTQGDYGLWQCSRPCHKRTYNNKDKVVKMLIAQGFSVGERGELLVPETETGETDYEQLRMKIPSDLIPYCPVCGEPMTMNLRSDDRFAEDEGWHQASERYTDFLRGRAGKILFLELGVGYNTPGIIKYPFWQMTAKDSGARYCCINKGEAFCPEEIRDRAVCIDADIGTVIKELNKDAGRKSAG